MSENEGEIRPIEEGIGEAVYPIGNSGLSLLEKLGQSKATIKKVPERDTDMEHGTELWVSFDYEFKREFLEEIAEAVSFQVDETRIIALREGVIRAEFIEKEDNNPDN